MNLYTLCAILFRIFLICDGQSHSQRSIDLKNPIDIEARTSSSSFLSTRTKLNNEEARLPYIINRNEGMKSENVQTDLSFSRRRLVVADSSKPISQFNPERSALQRRRESELQVNEALRKRDQKLFISFGHDNQKPYPPLNIGGDRDRLYHDQRYHSDRGNYQFPSNSNNRPKLKPPILIIEKIPVLVTEKPSIFKYPTYNHNLDRRPDRYPFTDNHFDTKYNNRNPVNSYQNDNSNHNYYDASKGVSNSDNKNHNYKHKNHNHNSDHYVKGPPNFGSSDFYNKPYPNQYAHQYDYVDSTSKIGPLNSDDFTINGQYPDDFHTVDSLIPQQNSFDIPEPSFYPEEDYHYSGSFGPVPGELVEGHPIPHVIEEEYEDDLHTQRKLQAALAAQALAIGAIRQQAFARFALNQRLGRIAAARNVDGNLQLGRKERDHSADLHQPSASSNVDLSVYDDKIHREQFEKLSRDSFKRQMKTYIRQIMASDKVMNETDRRNFIKSFNGLRREAEKQDIDAVDLSSTNIVTSEQINSTNIDELFLQFLLKTPNSFFENEFDISKEDFIEKIVPRIFRSEEINQLPSSSWIPNSLKNIEKFNFNTPIDVETIGFGSKSISHEGVPKFLSSSDNQIKDSEFTIPTDATTGGFRPSLPISLTDLEDDKVNVNVHNQKPFGLVLKDEDNGVTPKIFYDKISHPKETASKTNFSTNPSQRKSSRPTKEMIQEPSSVPARIYFDDIHFISSSNEKKHALPGKFEIAITPSPSQQQQSDSHEDDNSKILPIFPGIDDDIDILPIRLFEKRKGSNEKPQTEHRQRYQEKPAVVTFAAPTAGPTLQSFSYISQKFTPLPVIDNQNTIDEQFELTDSNSYSNSGFGKRINKKNPQSRKRNSDQSTKLNTITPDNHSIINTIPEYQNSIANQVPAHYRIVPECAGGLVKQRSFCLFAESYPREAALKISSVNEELAATLLELVKKVENPKIDLIEAAKQIPGLNGSKSCEEETKEVNLGWFEDVLGNWLVILQPFRQNNLSQPITVKTCSIKSRNEGCKPLLLPRPMVAFHPEDENGKPFISQFAVPVTCVHAE